MVIYKYGGQICLTSPERFKKDASDWKNDVKFLVKLFYQVVTAHVTWRNRTHFVRGLVRVILTSDRALKLRYNAAEMATNGTKMN